jgi:hypothetical protein
MLNPDLAEQFSGVALANVTTEFPYKLDQVLAAEGDLALPCARRGLISTRG